MDYLKNQVEPGVFLSSQGGSGTCTQICSLILSCNQMTINNPIKPCSGGNQFLILFQGH